MSEIKTALDEQNLVELLVELESISRQINDDEYPMLSQLREDVITAIQQKLKSAA